MTPKRQGRSILDNGLVWACGGLAAGAGLVLVVAMGLFAYRLFNPLPPTPTPVILPSPTPVPFPTPWSTPTSQTPPTPLSGAQAALTPRPRPSPAAPGLAFLDAAEDALSGGSAQTAIDLVKPELGNLSRPSDLARAYTCLGKAEMELYHFQFAAAYFSQLYDLQPTAEHLLWLATSYDLGGDLDRALAKYQALAAMPGAEADEYRDEVKARVADLEDVLHHTPGAPTPAP